MVIAVTVVWVMQTAIDQVIDMVAVRDGWVAAIGTATAGARHRRTSIGVGCADFDDMLIVVAFVRKVQVTVMQVANMVAVLDAQVAAICAVNVGMFGVGGMGHGNLSFFVCSVTLFPNGGCRFGWANSTSAG